MDRPTIACDRTGCPAAFTAASSGLPPWLLARRAGWDRIPLVSDADPFAMAQDERDFGNLCPDHGYRPHLPLS